MCNRGYVRHSPSGLSPERRPPVAARWAVVTATVFGALGGAVGLIVGLAAYAPTAPFAVLEVGLPASACGAVIGAAAGGATLVWRRVRR
jgi:hypothetical protein